MRNDFCIFICSNGRAGSVTTIKALEGSGYTGDWYILCDDLDRQLDDYRREYGVDRVQVFDKKAMAAIIDTGTNDGDMRAIVYARNACFDVAKSLEATAISWSLTMILSASCIKKISMMDD